jgi:short-subunit dehydrogenase
MISTQAFIDKVVVITGASRGIGRSTALAFAQAGAKTVLVARTASALDQTANEIRTINPNVLSVVADISLPEEINTMIDQVMVHFGRIDVLINNAGGASVGSVDEPRFAADTQALMAVSFYGTVNCTQAVLSIMRKQGTGHIVNMSSLVGRKAFPKFGAYSATMHAITGFSDALRQELRGSGIHVSTIHPALTQTRFLQHVDPTDMPPAFRKMTPLTTERVARSILRAVQRRQTRVILPFAPKLLLLQDALSTHLGDQVMRLLSYPAFSFLLGLYRGGVYEH